MVKEKCHQGIVKDSGYQFKEPKLLYHLVNKSLFLFLENNIEKKYSS